MTIREGKISDLNNIVKIENQVYKNPYWSVKMFERLLLNNSNERLWAYEKESLLLGFLIDLRFEDEINILDVAIDSSYQNRGHGYNMFLDYINIVPKKCTIFLEVNENNNKALSMYNKHCFKKINKREAYYNDGSDAIIMKLVK
jgi:ribosomal-protein-alanine N-acetyltransferase|tara:strand:+ start:96 stop:527 length:432 start_codon:yes stop_codon:yes gene_type:complete